MTAFTEIEQEVMDLAWYAIDDEGRIGHFTTGGGQLLPPSVAKSKETLEKINKYFSNLPILQEDNYTVCPDLATHIDRSLITNMDGYIRPSAEMSARGLYSYDSHPMSNERMCFRVTIPKEELKLTDLPEDIKIVLEKLRMSEINFTEDSLIQGKFVTEL